MSNFSGIKRSKAPLGWWVGDWEVGGAVGRVTDAEKPRGFAEKG